MTMPMRNIKIILEYDGSVFYGFQKQPRHPTIQEALETALSKLLNRKTKIAAASGRTDTGVHAVCQVVNFRCTSRLSLAQIQKGLNALLPKQIAVREASEAGSDFHARYQARFKRYQYRVYNHPVRSPLRSNRAFHVPEPLSLPQMRAAAKILTGRHDFRAFCASSGAGSQKKNTVRTVKSLEISKKGDEIIFEVSGDGFLYKMVRNLVGLLIEVGRKERSVRDVERILASTNRCLPGSTAPAHGLTLVDVRY